MNTISPSLMAGIGPFGPITFGVSAEQQILLSRSIDNIKFHVTMDEESATAGRYFYPSSNGEYSASITRIGVSVQGTFGGNYAE